VEDNLELQHLYALYLKNQCSNKELGRFFDLVKELKDDGQIKLLLSGTWEETASAQDREVDFPVIEEIAVVPVIQHPRSNWFSSLWKVAAVLVVALSAYLYYKADLRSKAPLPAVAVTYIEKVTLPGQKIRITLPDSSKVWLNASSKIRFASNFNDTKREIFMEGEAFFDVHHNKRKPFKVTTNKVNIVVLGTAFNVYAYANEQTSTITVIRGKVGVSKGNKLLSTLTPSQQLKYNNNGTYACSVVDTAAIVGWKSGKLQFDNATMGQIANSLQRWYGVQIKFSDPKLKACHYTASFDNNISINNLLRVLCNVNHINYTIKNNVVMLYGKGCYYN
jgi:transmembrane sensor